MSEFQAKIICKCGLTHFGIAKEVLTNCNKTPDHRLEQVTLCPLCKSKTNWAAIEDSKMQIHITSLVRRQTPESAYSHWTISDEELLKRVSENLGKAVSGYREGVILVPVDPVGFYSGIVKLQEGDKLVGEFKARQAGEDPRKSSFALRGKKIAAKSVYVVLYSHDVLAEKNENETDAEYEIVSVNASPTEGEVPIPTGALIANHLGLSGGTDTKMTDSEFVALLRKSMEFWKDKALAAPEYLKGISEKPELENPTPAEVVERINVLCKDQVRHLYENMEKLGAVVKDEYGHKIPQPQTDQDRIMFAAGQVSLAAFIQGATMMVIPSEEANENPT